MPQDLRKIEIATSGSTLVHPMSLILLAVLFVLLLIIKKKYVFIPLIIVAILVPASERIVVGSFDFTFIRIMTIGLFLRLFFTKERNNHIKNKIDIYFILYVLVLSLAYILLRRSSSALANRLGFVLDSLLTYFMVRHYFDDLDQLLFLIRTIVVISLFIAIGMVIERTLSINLFFIFGADPNAYIGRGEIRGIGPFSHPILAGTYGALIMPIVWVLNYTHRQSDKRLYYIGMISAFTICFAASSSGAILSLAAAIFGLFLWKYRHYTLRLFYLFLLSLVLLDIVMDAPVWHLLARIDITGGSTGYHRYLLIDQAIRNFSEWALLGVYTTGHWGWGLNDVTNMYVLQAVNGGVVTFLLFVVVISQCFVNLKNSNILNEKSEIYNRSRWSLGVMLFVHCVSFLGVSYFGQMNFFWFFSVGLFASYHQIKIDD